MSALECQNAIAAERYAAEVAPFVWEAQVRAGCFVEGRWNFASLNAESRDTVKFDGEVLYRDGNERHLGTVLSAVAGHPCIKEADVLLYVPDGMRKFVNLLGGWMGVLVSQVERTPKSASRYDFRFPCEADKITAHTAVNPRIVEDVVSTLGSVAGVRRLLLPGQNVHAVSYLLRGSVNPDYESGLSYHTLVRRDIPLGMTAPEFYRGFGFWPVANTRK